MSPSRETSLELEAAMREDSTIFDGRRIHDVLPDMNRAVRLIC